MAARHKQKSQIHRSINRMAFQIYQDNIENFNSKLQNGKKSRRGEMEHNRLIVPKANKRTALGTITNTIHGQQQGSRKQPSRAVKEKNKVPSNKVHDIPFKIHEDVKARSKLEQKQTPNLPCFKDSPMILSPAPLTESFEDIKSDDLRKLGIEDIDSKTNSALDCPEYAHDIHTYLKNVEVKFCPKQFYLKKQVDINDNMRAILIDWLVEVAEEYKLLPQTLYLTVNYIDRFLSYMSVLRGKLQLVGAACMLVAAKFEEIYPPEVSEFVYITDDTYTAQQVLRMEHLVLKTLSFDISIPTCLDFLSRYLLAAGGTSESQLKYLSQYLCELTLIHSKIYLKYVPSTIAAASMYLSNAVLGFTPWTPTLEFYSGYTADSLQSCIADLHKMHQNCSDLPQQSIQQKYKTPKFGCVSKLSPLQSIRF